jgi:uncharacterized protein YdeI (YjbR/CyaY-like superfamily)
VTVQPKFFKSGAEFRAWLDKHHDSEDELVAGFYKRGTGKPSPTYQEALDAALAYGWIDGIRRSLDGESYTIRYTPRRKRSIWSAINIKRVAELESRGLMHDSGLAVFAARDPARAGLYSFENAPATLDPARERTLRAKKKAWAFFESQPPGYKRTATFWVESAKREETKDRRLATLIGHSAKGERLPQLTSPTPKTKAPK